MTATDEPALFSERGNVFTDFDGRPWTCEITRGVIRRVERATKVNLIRLFEERAALIEKLFNDPPLLVDVLCVVCQAQAKDQGVSEESFGEAMRGDVLYDGGMALLEGLIRFFPNDQRRAILRAFLVKVMLLRDRIEAETLSVLASLDVDRLATRSKPSPGNASESSA